MLVAWVLIGKAGVLEALCVYMMCLERVMRNTESKERPEQAGFMDCCGDVGFWIK